MKSRHWFGGIGLVQKAREEWVNAASGTALGAKSGLAVMGKSAGGIGGSSSEGRCQGSMEASVTGAVFMLERYRIVPED